MSDETLQAQEQPHPPPDKDIESPEDEGSGGTVSSMPPLPGSNAPGNTLYSMSFDQRLEQIRMELAEEAEKIAPVFEKESWWDRSKRYLPIVIVIVWLIASAFMFTNPQAGQSVFVLSEIRIVGPTDLCPGETLDFEFDVMVKETGTYNLWMSTWKTEPPPSTIIFSEVQPFVIGSVRSFPITRQWLIPETYLDPADSSDKPMLPGAYIRDISVTAEGRNTGNKPLQVKFNIRDDCREVTNARQHPGADRTSLPARTGSPRPDGARTDQS